MNPLILRAFFLIFLLSSALVSAQVDTATDDTKLESNLPYEIIVRADVTKVALRSLIVEVEDDFWARFNELNIDDHYDVICFKYTPTMSHIRKRACEPNFYRMERAENASAYMFGLGGANTGIPGSAKASSFLLSGTALRDEVRTGLEILQGKMEELTRTDLEFRLIGNALGDLKDRLENHGKD